MSNAVLAGRVAIVTGAGKGLGRAYALHLAVCGASVLVNNRRHPGESDAATSAAATVAAIRAAGGQAAANYADVGDATAGDSMVRQALDTFGGLDIVVANAGVATAAPFHKTSAADFNAVFDASFFGTLHLVQAAWPQLRERRYGRMVLTASSAGLYGVHGMVAYSAAKAAIIGLMRALAIEGAALGVKANVVAPYAYSQMTAPWMDSAQAAAFDPAKVAPLVAWLASEACDVSGEAFVSGAGFVRRMAVGETRAVPLDADEVARSIAALSGLPVRGYANAVEAFASFLGESCSER